jgi:hypothetical protein
MNDINERPLKELFAAIYNDKLKNNSLEIRGDQEKVLNELLGQPDDFQNIVVVSMDGLEIQTQEELIQYIHSKSLESRVVTRNRKVAD